MARPENVKFGVLGKNIGYSLSPKIHKAVFEVLGIQAEYDLINFSKTDLSKADIDEIKHQYKGFNVTIPFKEKIMPFLDEVTEDAWKIGAVNTVRVETKGLVGYNTDYIGFRVSLERAFDWPIESAIVLGTGGAAKMAVAVLKDLKVRTIFTVTREKGGILGTQTLSYERLEALCPRTDLLINATPIGSVQYKDQMPISEALLKKQKGVFDMVYVPEKTKLLQLAETLNIPRINGFNMLLIQAVAAESIWLERELDVMALVEAIGPKCK
ncbi:shikimate dehydrogenase family protein [Fusibacter tunisiensis]|uniref:Shikimate dehydrogenase n=1 Tax=Fusibacter tunisiensis TaxID=1008308 RepID=A0ABS2MRI3_9FIRM|nr:shikimate dehydrogenase [Fusibacter tunisiensis]MBM7562028.1 shikimate dehydrogenase [Fusibacter tunisiensis]